MNELQVFNFNNNQIRTLLINDEPYWVGKDIADVLGYERADNAIRSHVDEEDKLMHQISALGQSRKMTIINESGLYSLVLSSKLPQAKEFKRWVTSEVLPTIRKHGAYMTEKTLEQALTSPDFLIKLAKELKTEKEKNEQLKSNNKMLTQINNELKPKADYFDAILKNKGLVTISQIAKDYGMSGRKFNTILHDLGVQYKQSGQWLLYSKYHSKGYTMSETIDIERNDGKKDVVMNTKWTQKGRIFLYELLKQNGIVPTIEKNID